MGLTIPRDVMSLVGSTISLSRTFHRSADHRRAQPIAEIGPAGAKLFFFLLIERLGGKEGRTPTCPLPTRLVIRGSVAPLKKTARNRNVETFARMGLAAGRISAVWADLRSISPPDVGPDVQIDLHYLHEDEGKDAAEL